uniref:ANK_REP_REGION domain-containing protein n=1 Tax=Macrostomum lignano TaxID=282301 RepID=A0A1I8F179_9PLAT
MQSRIGIQAASLPVGNEAPSSQGVHHGAGVSLVDIRDLARAHQAIDNQALTVEQSRRTSRRLAHYRQLLTVTVVIIVVKMPLNAELGKRRRGEPSNQLTILNVWPGRKNSTEPPGTGSSGQRSEPVPVWRGSNRAGQQTQKSAAAARAVRIRAVESQLILTCRPAVAAQSNPRTAIRTDSHVDSSPRRQMPRNSSARPAPGASTLGSPFHHRARQLQSNARVTNSGAMPKTADRFRNILWGRSTPSRAFGEPLRLFFFFYQQSSGPPVSISHKPRRGFAVIDLSLADTSQAQRLIAAVLMQASDSDLTKEHRNGSEPTNDRILEAVITEGLPTIARYPEKPLNKDRLIDKNGEDTSPLHLGVPAWKAQYCRPHTNNQVVDSLIKAQADVNLQEINGCSPLYMASQNGHVKVVESLIKAQADVNLQDINGCSMRSPLKASQNGHQQVVDLLIKAQADADVNTQRRTGLSPLYLASQNGHWKIVELLIEAQASVNLQEQHYGSSPLYIAAQNGHQQVVNALIKSASCRDFQQNIGSTPLHIASENGHLHIVDSLIKAQADVNLQRSTDRLHSTSHPRMGIRKSSSCLSKLKLILTHHQAQANANLHQEFDGLLIKAQASVNHQDIDGCSPLYIASQNGHKHIVNLLIKAQADVNLQRHNGTSPIRIASQRGHQEIVDLLIKSDADSSNLLERSNFINKQQANETAAADVLQEMLRLRLQDEDRFIVGSYSEGWGNSLKTLNGKIDEESDIDDPAPGFPVRPALDDVTAGRLCRYPPIAPLQPQRISRSNIPKPVLQALQKVVDSDSTPCHVMHAASPGRGGQELRVSTSFLEKRMLRSLTTLQGQLFVTLKYLVKKVICSKDGFNQQRLKSYHVKSITFRMVEETPIEQWKPENLVSLVRRSLQMLLGCVESSRSPDNAHGRIMEHFFLCDIAWGKTEAWGQTLGSIASTLRTVIDRLPQLLQQFMSSLRPVSGSGIFYFHPFQILPDLRPRAPLPQPDSLEYHEIYDVASLGPLRSRRPTRRHREFVWRHLRSQDSAWKFCFELDNQTKLSFLTGALNECFPLRLSSSTNHHYVNFDALLWALQLELKTGGVACAQDCIRDVVEREDVDQQEL